AGRWSSATVCRCGVESAGSARCASSCAAAHHRRSWAQASAQPTGPSGHSTWVVLHRLRRLSFSLARHAARAARRRRRPQYLPRRWPRVWTRGEFLALARDEAVPGRVRKSAVFWVGQAVSERATLGLSELVEDDDVDLDARETAVFALSQRPDAE